MSSNIIFNTLLLNEPHDGFFMKFKPDVNAEGSVVFPQTSIDNVNNESKNNPYMFNIDDNGTIVWPNFNGNGSFADRVAYTEEIHHGCNPETGEI